jgi:hypothetical protein
MPKIAWDALEANLDGPAIRRLAALNKPTYFEIAEVLPRAMEEMQLARIEVGEAATRIAKYLVSQILQSGVDPITRTNELQWLWIRAGYPSELQEIGTLYDDASVWSSMGTSDKKIRRQIVETFEKFLAT